MKICPLGIPILDFEPIWGDSPGANAILAPISVGPFIEHFTLKCTINGPTEKGAKMAFAPGESP